MIRFHLILVSVALAASLSAAADWPGFLGPTRDGQSVETKLHWDWRKAAPMVAWKKDVGGGFAGPVVADGKLILHHRMADENLVEAFAADTGKPAWKFAYPARYRDGMGQNDGPRTTPLVADGLVFTLGPAGELHALDLKSGEKKWEKNIRKEYAPPDGYFGVGSGLIALGGKLLVNVGAKGAGIVAFDTATGKEAWKATDDPPGYSTPSSVTLGGKPHAVFFTRTGLVVVNAETGAVTHSLRHRARIDASVNAATPLVKGDEVFLTTSYSTGAILLKLAANEPEPVWANDTSLSCHFNTPVRVGDYLYGVHGRQEGNSAALVCVEWATGKVMWAEKTFGCAHLIAVDGGVIAVTDDGQLVRFAAGEKGYAEAGRLTVSDSLTRAAPALANGVLYVRNEKQLLALKLKE